MTEITKVYKQTMEATRFIGKKYGDDDRVGGMFGALWGEWFGNGWFDVIESQIDETAEAVFEDGDAYIGLQRWKDGEPYEYWIGMFTPVGTAVPEGYQFYDFSKGELGVCWVYGKEEEVFCQEQECAKKLAKNGLKIVNDENDACWFFERYACPRFTDADDKGNVTLDICYFVE
jgi:hypothetical protein